MCSWSLATEISALISRCRPDNCGVPQVRFLGWRGDLETIYGATDIFVLTSRNEGTPVALIEAMAAGVASVSTDVGGVRDVISNNDLGSLVPSGDLNALVAAVTELADDPVRAAGARSSCASVGASTLSSDASDQKHRRTVRSGSQDRLVKQELSAFHTRVRRCTSPTFSVYHLSSYFS